MDRKPYISNEGHKKLRELLNNLQEKDLEIILRIKENRETETGDDSENLEKINLSAEREAVSNKFNQLERFLESCHIVDLARLPPESEVVRFGTTVVLLDLNSNKRLTYTILGEHESNPKKQIISYLSPLGKILMGEHRGASVYFDAPSGPRDFEIISISRN